MGAETFVGIGLVAFAILFLGYMSYKCSRDKARVPPPAKPVETPAYNPTALTEMEDGRGSGSFVVLQDKVRDSNILDASPPSQTHVSAKLVSFSVGSSVGVGSHFVVTKPTATDDIAILEDEEDDDDMMVIQHAPMKKLGDGLAEDDFDIVDQDLYRSSTSFSKGMDGRYSHFSMVSELSAYETASEYESRMSQASRDSYMTDYDGKEARI